MKNIIKFRKGAFNNNLLRLVIFLSIFYSSTAYALPNLTPFKPSTWSDKIVVSNTIGTNTDSSPLYTTDTLYIDWAVLNNGDAATEATFYIKLYVDGVEKATWVADLESYYYAYVTDYSIGSLSQGTHTIKIVADTSNTIAEGNEDDNAYTRTITVTDLDVNSPNLTPFKPSTWSDKIVVSNTTGTNTDSGVLYSTDTLYLDWAVINNGLQPTAAIFSTKLYVDGVEKKTWSTSPPLNVGGYVTATDYSLGALSKGTHTIKIVTDTGGTIAESNETDNAYARVITVLKPGAAIERALVLLVDFSDEEGQESREYFQQMMFGNMPSAAPKGSFMDYYLEVSYGQFQVVGMVNNADVEWIRLPQTSVYYAAGCYGISKGCTNVYPQNAQRMVEDAVNAAKALGLDFGPYDSDNDGFVDSLFVIHAGRGGENSGNSNDIWSHKWATSYNVDTGSKNALNNTVYVRTYSTEPEYWYALHDMTIGVYAHEYGHILGLPDLYDTDYTSQGVGRWSLMAGGSWNGTLGDTPAHMDAWSKYRLSWITPAKVTGTLAGEAIDAAETHNDFYQLLDGVPGVSGEYFLVENRQKTNFDAGLPSSGLLIWHIDEAKSGNTAECYPGGPSCVTGHYKVALVQADNLWEMEKNLSSGNAGDPFPGSKNNTTFDAASSPDSNLYSGTASSVGVSGISASGATMTATLTRGAGGAGSIQLSASGYSVAEDGGAVTITATRTGGGSGAAGVSYATSNGTAAAGSDYTAGSGTLSWADGDTANKSFTVAITNDILDEASETFAVTLSNPTGGAALGIPASATVTIMDNDPAPTVQFPQATSSGSEATTPAAITVTLSAASGKTVMVNYASSNGTATAGSDYTATAGTLTFTPGQTNRTINVPITNDTAVEGSETFSVTLSSPVSATLGTTTSHTYTITDNDVALEAPVPFGVQLACPVKVTAGQPLTVTLNLYNWDCSDSMSVSRFMMSVIGNADGTLSGLGIYGPYNRWLGTPRVVPPADCGIVITPGTVTPFKLTVMNAVPASLGGKMATVNIEAVTNKGQTFGGGECVVNVLP